METIITRKSISEHVISLFQAKNSSPITELTIVSDLFTDMDSLDAIDIIMKLEEAYEINIPDEDIRQVKSDNEPDYTFRFKFKIVGDLVNIVLSNINSKACDEKNEINFGIELEN